MMKRIENMYFVFFAVVMLTAEKWSQAIGLNRKLTPLDVVLAIVPSGLLILAAIEGFRWYKRRQRTAAQQELVS